MKTTTSFLTLEVANFKLVKVFWNRARPAPPRRSFSTQIHASNDASEHGPSGALLPHPPRKNLAELARTHHNPQSYLKQSNKRPLTPPLDPLSLTRCWRALPRKNSIQKMLRSLEKDKVKDILFFITYQVFHAPLVVIETRSSRDHMSHDEVGFEVKKMICLPSARGFS